MLRETEMIVGVTSEIHALWLRSLMDSNTARTDYLIGFSPRFFLTIKPMSGNSMENPRTHLAKYNFATTKSINAR